jgi:hypothetical protein
VSGPAAGAILESASGSALFWSLDAMAGVLPTGVVSAIWRSDGWNTLYPSMIIAAQPITPPQNQMKIDRRSVKIWC